MTDAMKQEFTCRITNANRTEMIVILCDMFDIYLTDAKSAIEDGDKEGFKTEIGRARAVLSELIKSLDTHYEIAANIYGIYRFIERCLIKAELRYDKTLMIPCMNMMRKLNESYEKVAKLDPSPAIMQNTETVYAGMTYGRNDISESHSMAANRGYWA